MSATKPFNAEHAKAGAPYGCRNGNQATVLKWDAQNRDFPLVGTIIFSDGSEQPESWTINGMRAVDMGEGESDLVMLQLGHIVGKPVFVGDEYEFEGTRYRAVENGSGGFDSCRWPEPAKQYPQTKMTDQELYAPDSLRATANAALRHAIDNGQVVEKEKVDAAVDALMAIRHTPARDMAIAEAVQAWAIDRAHGPYSAVRDGCEWARQYITAVRAADLPAIIATVKP